MPDLKAAILLFYYERPGLVCSFLKSVQKQTYKNYELIFIDDSEDFQDGFNAFNNHNIENKTYIHTGDTLEAKQARGGSMFGHHANLALLESDADFVVVGCDDDALTPWYLEELNEYYKANLEVMYSYCDVITFDPSQRNWQDVLDQPASDHFLNHNHNDHNGGNSKDSSQMSFRLSCFKEGNARWVAPLTACLDFHMWNSLNFLYGPAVWNSITGQCKAYWSQQLGGRSETYKGADL